MTEKTALTALINATTGHLYFPVVTDADRANDITPSLVLAATSIVHEGTTCPGVMESDDLDQITRTCQRCENVALTVLRVFAILGH